MAKLKPKVAFVIDGLGYGGAQKQLSILVGALRAFIEPQVYCLSGLMKPFGDLIREQGVPVFELRRRSNFDLRRLLALAKTISNEQVDIVHGFLDAANAYSYLAARKLHLPVVLSLRNERFRVSGVRTRVLCEMLRRSEGVVVNSRAGERYLVSTIRVPQKNITFVNNAVANTTDQPAVRHPSPTGPTIGFVGRLTKQKRIDLLIDAFALLRESHPEAQLVLVGEGEDSANLKAHVRRLQLGGCVTMTGAIANVSDHMRRFTCLALPSAYEGLPNVVLEALALGVPVLASPAGDLEEIIRDGNTGYLLRETSAAALHALLLRVIGNTSLRDSVATEGPRLIKQEFAVGPAVERLCELYNSLALREHHNKNGAPR